MVLVKLFDVSASPGAVETNNLAPLSVESPGATVQDLKKQISTMMMNPDPIQQSATGFQLSFNGRILPDSVSVSEFDSNSVLYAVIGSSFKQEGVPVKKKPKTVNEIDIMRVFNGLRLCLSERTKRRRLHVTLLSRENTKALLASVPGLADDLEAVALLKYPMLLYRMAAAPEECHRLIAKHPVLGEALSHVLSQVANANATEDSSVAAIFNDPVVALVTGLGLLEEEEEDPNQMEGVQQARRQPRQNARPAAPPNILFAPPRQQVRPPAPALPAVSPQMLTNALSAVLLGLAQQPRTAAQPSQPSSSVPQQPRFAAELETIRSMGIANDAVALAALEATNGNVEAAIEFILSSME